MLKVQILDHCSYRDGKANLPVDKATYAKGEPFARYTPCQMCEGTGEGGKWVSLTDFLEMLKQTHFRHEHTSYRDGVHFSAGNVWDDIEEVCDDCGSKLDHQTLGDFIQDAKLIQSNQPRMLA